MEMGQPPRTPPPLPQGRRRDPRLRLGVPAQLITLDGQATASLQDLSASGAHVRVAGRFSRAGDAVLYWMGFEAFGRIVWASASEAGLEFDVPLPQPVLLQTRQQVDSGQVRSFEQAAYDGARSWYHGWR